MLKKISLSLVLILLSVVCYGQTDPLFIAKYIRLPGDSIQNKQLIAALNGFLSQAEKPNKENTFVLAEDLPETSILLNEIKGMKDGKGPDKKNFYKCYLTNVVALDSAENIIQFSFVGMDGIAPILRASFELFAKKVKGQYYFSSPFKRNTALWHVKAIGNFYVYYTAAMNFTKIDEYIKRAKEFDKRLKAPAYKTSLYFASNLPLAAYLLGVEYKMDYNGLNAGDFSSFENNNDLDVVTGDLNDPEVLDIHDLWHDRLHHVIPVSIINKPVDEACAYLYGGSWGLSWQEIFKRFKTFMGTDKDWLKAFNENKNFGVDQRYHFYVSYVINALIVQQIEKEKGFDAVKELLSCGKREDSNENYFKALEKITGISKANFNDRIGVLVNNEDIK